MRTTSPAQGPQKKYAPDRAVSLACLMLLTAALASCAVADFRMAVKDPTLTSQEPLVTHRAGRHEIRLPASFILKENSNFHLNGPREYVKRYGTESIRIREIPWREGDRETQFTRLWSQFQDKGGTARRYGPTLRDRDGDLHYAENLDARDLFGHPSVIICTIQPHDTHSFIALPQGILWLTEDRDWGGVFSCDEFGLPAAHLFPYYRWGKEPDEGVRVVFHTREGHVADYPASLEKANIFFKNPDGLSIRIISSYTTRKWIWPGETGFPSPEKVEEKARQLRVAYTSFLRRERPFAGQTVMEIIWRGKELKQSRYRLFFLLSSLDGYKDTPEKPDFEITLECDWEHREQALRVWNTLLQNFRTPGSAGLRAAQ